MTAIITNRTKITKTRNLKPNPKYHGHDKDLFPKITIDVATIINYKYKIQDADDDVYNTSPWKKCLELLIIKKKKRKKKKFWDDFSIYSRLDIYQKYNQRLWFLDWSVWMAFSTNVVMSQSSSRWVLQKMNRFWYDDRVVKLPRCKRTRQFGSFKHKYNNAWDVAIPTMQESTPTRAFAGDIKSCHSLFPSHEASLEAYIVSSVFNLTCLVRCKFMCRLLKS